jgi:hypothetical protein
MEDETLAAIKAENAELKDSVIIWKRSAELAVQRAENAEKALKELHDEALDRGIERDLMS